MKIVFTGNCQASALTQLVHFLEPKIDVITAPPVYDIPAFSSEKTKEDILSADFIFAQRVSEDHGAEYIRPSQLQKLASGRHLIWPNIYFDGYFPGIRYMYSENGTKVTGPISDYHFDQIENSWRSGKTALEAHQTFTSNAEPSNGITLPAEESLSRLKTRERVCDITISDFIEERFKTESLFYSMNHPKNSVLFETLKRMMKSSNIEIPIEDIENHTLENFPQTLNEIELPTLPYVSSTYGMKAREPITFKGKNLQRSLANEWVSGNERQIYSSMRLVEAFYQVYDSIPPSKSHLVEGYD